MMKYIKKLRASIKCLLGREDANLAEIAKLNGLLEAAEKNQSEIVKGHFPLNVFCVFVVNTSELTVC